MYWLRFPDRMECWDRGCRIASVHPIRSTDPARTGWEVVICRPKPAPDTGFKYFCTHFNTHAQAMLWARGAVQVYY